MYFEIFRRIIFYKKIVYLPTLYKRDISKLDKLVMLIIIANNLKDFFLCVKDVRTSEKVVLSFCVSTSLEIFTSLCLLAVFFLNFLQKNDR